MVFCILTVLELRISMDIEADSSILSNPAAENAFVEIANPNVTIGACLYVLDSISEIDRANKVAGLIVDRAVPISTSAKSQPSVRR